MGRQWSTAEDETLVRLVNQHGKQWGIISSQMENRSASQVAARWEKSLDPKLAKGSFTEEEDQLIIDYVGKHGPQNWPALSEILVQRSPKQCRERWCNHLNPKVTSGAWTIEEDALIFDSYERTGPKWSLIAHSLPGRTDNAIKNRWNSSISKRVHVDAQGRRSLLPEGTRRTRRSGRERPQIVPERVAIPSAPPQPHFVPVNMAQLQPWQIAPEHVAIPSAPPQPHFVPVNIAQLQPWQIAILQQMNLLGGAAPAPTQPPPRPRPDDEAPFPSPFRIGAPISPRSPFAGYPGLPTPGSMFTLDDGPTTPVSPYKGFDMNVFQ
jgi:hypothetical protein